MIPCMIKKKKKGIREGLYRSEIDIQFMAAVFIHYHISVIQTNTLSHHGRSASQVFQEITQFFLHGICTEKGKKQLNKYLNK